MKMAMKKSFFCYFNAISFITFNLSIFFFIITVYVCVCVCLFDLFKGRILHLESEIEVDLSWKWAFKIMIKFHVATLPLGNYFLPFSLQQYFHYNKKIITFNRFLRMSLKKSSLLLRKLYFFILVNLKKANFHLFLYSSNTYQWAIFFCGRFVKSNYNLTSSLLLYPHCLDSHTHKRTYNNWEWDSISLIRNHRPFMRWISTKMTYRKCFTFP